MARFKAGDRVKILAGHPYWLGEHRNGAGEEGEGVYVGRAGKEHRGKHLVEVTYDGGRAAELSFKGREIEPLVAAEWVPKVGDRVRCIKDYDAGSQFTAGKEYAVRYVRDDAIGVVADDKGNPNGWGREYFAQPLPDAEQPAPLTIEAGKFYRTRDGRKVGPMEEHYGTAWDDKEALLKASIDGDIRLFRATSGIHLFGKANLDLVAEWAEPDSPAIAVATPEPAAPPAKFKVGDRVTPKAERLRQIMSHWNEHWRDDQGEAVDYVFFVRRDPSPHLGLSISAALGGEGPWWPEEYFEPAPTPVGATTDFIVARLTANGQPRPNARPRVHATLASATAEASRLANRLGDEFAVYQRVATESVDAGPVPKGWDTETLNVDRAKRWLETGSADDKAGLAFSWDDAPQGFNFWWGQATSTLTPLGRAILRKWVAEVEAATAKEAA